ncbi:MAG: DUF434 domain-containing protein [Gemmataceae bacterium]
MPDTRKHRGSGPKDAEWFGPETIPRLRTGVEELSWLLTRDYADVSALKLVGDRHRLVERQRVAVRRSACADSALADRVTRRLDLHAVRGRSLQIDGFNLILTLESALGGGVILGGRDGCFRDLASVHATYRRVEETRPALDLAAKCLTAWGVESCVWHLDAPVSNSGRLAAMIRETHPSWSTEVVQNPDTVLSNSEGTVVTADSAVLDRCGSWVNLAREIIINEVQTAWVVDLGS